jgi:hypothetical protein
MERMRDLLRSSLSRSLETLSPEDRLAAAWQVVCGAVMAARGEIRELDAEGILHIRVASPEWFDEFISRRASLRNDLSRIAAVPLTGIHFEKVRSAR